MPRMQANTISYSNYFFIDWDLVGQNVGGNYSTINWRAYWHFQNSDRQLDNGYANLGNATRWANGGRIYNYAQNFSTRDMLLASGSFNIGHNGDGTQSLYVAGGVTGYQNERSERGQTWGLPTIPRGATMTGAGNFTDEENPSFSYTNPAGAPLDVWLEPNPNGPHLAVRGNIPNTGGYTWSLSDEERDQLRAALYNRNSAPCRIGLYSYVGGQTFASYIDVWLTIVNANPVFTIDQASYQDTNATTVAITTDNQKIVQNQSTLQAAFTAATARKSASIVSYQVTLGTNVKTFTAAQTAIDYGAVNLANDTPIVIEATDTRGNKTSISKTVSILPWQLPYAVITAGRVNNYEDATDIKADVTLASVNGKNAVTVLKARYKKTADTTWSEAPMQSNVYKRLTLDKLFEWNVEVTLTDKFGTTTYILLIQKGIPIMFMDVGKLSVGIGKFPTGSETLEIADEYLIPTMKKVHPIGIILTSSANTNPGDRPELAGTTWVTAGTSTTNTSPSKTLYLWERTA